MSNSNTQHKFSVTIQGGFNTTVLDNNDIYFVRMFEDIYSYSKTVHIVTKDTKALSEMLPIVGNETIKISYSSTITGEGEITKEFEFSVFKINTSNFTDKNRFSVEIFGIDKNYKKLHTWRHSRSYSDACYTYMDMARYILETIGEIEIGEFENCEEKLQYFYNGLKTPIECAKWLASRCKSVVTGSPGYVFYSDTKETMSDKLNVISLDTLFQQGPDMPPGDSLYTVRSHNEYHINNIISFQVNKPDKQNMRYLYGAYTLIWDIKRKKYIKVDLTYDEGLKYITCLGEKSLFTTTAIDTDISEYKRHFNTGESDEEIAKNLYYSDWVMRYCVQQTVQVNIEGHASRYAGGMIEWVFPSGSELEITDKNMTGLYLVKSITHQWMPSETPVYVQKLVLMKNGYYTSDPALISAVKVNTKKTVINQTTGGLPVVRV